MKLIRGSKAKLLFHLGHREGALLQQILKLYPRVPSAHQPLSKSGRVPNRLDNQRLLDEALAEQRAAHKKQVQALLADAQRFQRMGNGFRLSLTPTEVEWVLQVLNDIRVGSWVILGSPEGKLETLHTNTVQDLLAMEMAGYFQTELLSALEGSRND